jgi:hypothetical protein
MTELFGMIKKLAKKPADIQTQPFSTLRATRAWLDNVPKASDYDAHHAMVEGLERFNADTRGDAADRLKVLRVMEEAGVRVQDKIVEQYLRNQESLRFAKQSLWRESQMFWNHLSAAYLYLFRQAIKGAEREKLGPWLAEITLKSLYYTAMCIRWEYYRGQRASGLSWRRMHKIYRMSEISGVALAEVELPGKKTTCAREYVLALILELANPPGFKPREIAAVAELLDAIGPLPVPEARLRKARHTHCIDLSAPAGAEKLEGGWVHGRRLRYLELGGVIEAIEGKAAACPVSHDSLLFNQFARVISRGGVRRDGARTPRTGEAWAAEGLQRVMAALGGDVGTQGDLSRWALRDESREGLGFVLQGERSLPVGRLALVSYQPGEDAWKLITVRWVRHEKGETLVGAQCLSRHPKLVMVETNPGRSGFSPVGETGIFVPLADTSQGIVSNLLLPVGAYAPGAEITMRDDTVTYRLRLGEVAETHEEDWVRVGFDVLSREVQTPLAA